MKPIYDAWLIQIEITNACNIDGKSKKDLTLEDVLIIKQMPSLRSLEAIIRNPIEAISTSIKYPKDVLSFAVYRMKRKIKKLVSIRKKC